jgi:hypothetical protein
LTGATPTNAAITFSANIGRDGLRNQYANGVLDGVAYVVPIERGTDTSRPFTVRTLWAPTTANVSNVEFQCNYRIITTGDVLDGALGDTNVPSGALAQGGVANALRPLVTHDLDISSAVPGDVLVFSHFRDAGVAPDTSVDPVNIVDRSAVASFWQ